MASETFELIGGSGEKPKAPEEPEGFVYRPTKEHIEAMDDAALHDVYSAMVEYDASGGETRRRLKREIDRRAARRHDARHG